MQTMELMPLDLTNDIHGLARNLAYSYVGVLFTDIDGSIATCCKYLGFIPFAC